MLTKDSKIIAIALLLIILIIGVLYVLEWTKSDQEEDSSPTQFADSGVGYTPQVDAYGASPVDGSIVRTTAVDLRWRAGKLATSHAVYLHPDTDLVAAGDPKALLTETKETTAKASDLKPDTTYYWRVDAVNLKEPNSPWAGPVWNFRIPPRQAYHLYPPDGATHVRPDVRLNWDLAVDATTHRIAFGADANAVAADPGETLNVPISSYDPCDLSLGTTYYWRVDAVSEAAIIAGKVARFTVLSDTYITPAGDPNLIGWWKADEPATALGILDHSGNGLHAALEGSATWIKGVVDGAVELDGRSTFVTLKAPNTKVAEATISAWIRPKEMSTGVQGLVFWRGSSTSGLNLDSGNELRYHWNDEQSTWSFKSGLTVPTGEWSFVALVVEPNEARLYVNDLEAPAINATSHESSPFDGPLNLGRDPMQANRSFLGALDDMRFYNKALSQDELAELRGHTGAPMETLRHE